MSQLRDIAVGIIQGKLPAFSNDELARERLKVCAECPHFTLTRQCRLCYCFMDLKTKLLEAQCPAGKW